MTLTSSSRASCSYGNAFRGFGAAGVGPRDADTGDALGGTVYYVSSAELNFPTGLPADLGVRGSLFTDLGLLTRPQISGTGILDSSSPRMTWGLGLSWSSPLGPLRLDFAWPLLKKDYDQAQRFRFSFGTRF